MRIKFLLVSLVCLIFLLNYNLLQAAQIILRGVRSNPPNALEITIRGKIEKGDFEKIKKVIEDNKHRNKWIISVRLVSPGGDIVEAIKIGKLIRNNFIPTFAPLYFEGKPICAGLSEEQVDNGECGCTSACFLIWAAGVDRKGNVLGLHRPYFQKEYFKDLSASEAEIKYATMSNDVRIYLANMDIPENIIEKMFATGSDEILYIDEAIVESINKVPFFDEWIKASCKPLSKIENDEYFKLLLKYIRHKSFPKSENLNASEKFYYDYLHKKYWNYYECFYNKLMKAQLKEKPDSKSP